jgi:hypothetical protein
LALTLPTKNRLDCAVLPETNTLAFQDRSLLTFPASQL